MFDIVFGAVTETIFNLEWVIKLHFANIEIINYFRLRNSRLDWIELPGKRISRNRTERIKTGQGE